MPMGLYIVWSPKWELGIPIIDEQHRGIISLVNTLFYFIAGRRSEDVIIPLIRTVKRYWLLHCMTEEELIMVSGYPDAERHIENHHRLSAQLSTLMKEAIKTRMHPLVSDELMTFFRKIQIEHVSKDDFNLVSHVKNFFEGMPEAVTEEQDFLLKNANRISIPLHIEWSLRLELGIPIIDEQHRGIVSLINTLFYFISEARSEDITLPLVKTMECYWSLHCMTEEELLIQSGYPKTESHLALHQNMTENFSGFIKNAQKSENKAEVLDNLLAYLKKEQVMHTNMEDRQYVPHMKKYLLSRHEM